MPKIAGPKIAPDIDLIATEIVRADVSKEHDPEYELYVRIAYAIHNERSRCLRHVYALAESDNVAERVAKAIRSGK